MSITPYGITNGELTPTPDGELVKHDDHEAAVRVQAARSEAIGIQACLTTLRGLCHVWGMSHEEINQHAKFDKLLGAYTKCVQQATERIPSDVEKRLRLELESMQAMFGLAIDMRYSFGFSSWSNRDFEDMTIKIALLENILLKGKSNGVEPVSGGGNRTGCGEGA